jgi:hypothetical protein
MRALCLTLLFCSVAGCGGGGDAAPCAAGVSMQVVQAQVFDGCATSASGGCHQAAPFGANLNLTSGQAYGYLLHAPSNSSPGKWRVEPGDLAASFLWHKLTNTIATDNSEGVPMPRDSSDRWAPLTDAQLAAVRCWITSGAPNQ